MLPEWTEGKWQVYSKCPGHVHVQRFWRCAMCFYTQPMCLFCWRIPVTLWIAFGQLLCFERNTHFTGVKIVATANAQASLVKEALIKCCYRSRQQRSARRGRCKRACLFKGTNKVSFSGGKRMLGLKMLQFDLLYGILGSFWSLPSFELELIMWW